MRQQGLDKIRHAFLSFKSVLFDPTSDRLMKFVCGSQVCLGRQGKHGFAARRRGGDSHGLLQGKSPCLWAESASSKLQDIKFSTGIDASSRAAVANWYFS